MNEADGGSAAPPAVDGPVPLPDDGAGLVIDGKMVPRAKVLVFLHIGHSNMAGRASTPAALHGFFYDTDPHLWVYAKGNVLRPAREPTAPDNEMGQAAGPGMALLRTALAAAPDSYVISIGHGQSGSFGGHCSTFRKGALFYDEVMDAAVELKGKVTFVGIFTMFGQSEHNASTAEQKVFADCMAGVAGDMRGDLEEPALPFMVGDYEMGITRADIAPDSAFARPIIAQIQQIPGKVSRAAIIPTVGITMQDDHHFDLAGHKSWAERAIKLLVDNGWAPWRAP
jgi:hypothetical protein